MKKHILMILMIIAGAVFLYHQENIDPPEEQTLLHANLIAALELEDKIISSCGTRVFDYTELTIKAPLFEGLGVHTFPISTKSAEAQTYFNQGINLLYGFNHTEAHRSFKEAERLSGRSPMTFWGQAYALSPNINDSNLDEQRRKEAYDAISSANTNISKASKLEKALIKALLARFPMEDENIEVDNESYMMAMEEVARDFDDNPDVQTLYAASIMNTMPWDYWAEDMSPRPNTAKAKKALEKAIELNPNHPGAHHYYIHLTELPLPDLAANSGDALAPLMPGAGHMVHMPSHAYIRVGRYLDAAKANILAIQADEDYISQCYSQGIYPLGYYPHNIHFLWSAATLMGDSKTAIAAAKKTAEKVMIGQLAENTFMQEFAAIPLQAYVRFGQWNEILTVPDPGANVPHLKLFWHYARGMAFIRKGNLEEAKEELDALHQIVEDSGYDKVYATINNSGAVADVAYTVVAAEYYAAANEGEKADKLFSEAIEFEEALTYTEPPSWHLPVRHNYGAFLMDQEDYNKAIEVYNEDLQVLRMNGWSLKGLAEAQKGAGLETEAARTAEQFEKSWQYADISIERSVL